MSKKNKIFFILPNLDAGGAERVTITIARLLKKESYDVEFINIGTPVGEMSDWILPEFKLTSWNLSRTLKAIPRLVKFMKKNQKALFFSSREHVNMISLLCARLSGGKAIVRIPNMPRNVLTKGISGFKMNIIKSLNSWILKSANTIIAQNEEMKNQLIDCYHIPKISIKTIYNPIDRDYVLKSAENSINPYDQNECNFLTVCNVAYSKGIDVLMEAWSEVKKAIPRAHMYVVGRANSDVAKALIEKSHYLPDFTFVGFQINPYPYLKFCDTFVLASRMEGFPNVVLEAMCFDKPIATTECVEVIEQLITPGKNGYYCEIENSQALADCMIKASKITEIKNKYELFDKNTLIDCFMIK